jgi:hypothetical protein
MSGVYVIKKKGIEQEDYVAIIETLQWDMEPNDMELIAVDVVVLFIKISIIKLLFESLYDRAILKVLNLKDCVGIVIKLFDIKYNFI